MKKKYIYNPLLYSSFRISGMAVIDDTIVEFFTKCIKEEIQQMDKIIGIYLIINSNNAIQDADIDNIAEKLNMTNTEVYEAVNFMVENKLLIKEEDENRSMEEYMENVHKYCDMHDKKVDSCLEYIRDNL